MVTARTNQTELSHALAEAKNHLIGTADLTQEVFGLLDAKHVPEERALLREVLDSVRELTKANIEVARAIMATSTLNRRDEIKVMAIRRSAPENSVCRKAYLWCNQGTLRTFVSLLEAMGPSELSGVWTKMDIQEKGIPHFNSLAEACDSMLHAGLVSRLGQGRYRFDPCVVDFYKELTGTEYPYSFDTTFRNKYA